MTSIETPAAVEAVAALAALGVSHNLTHHPQVGPQLEVARLDGWTAVATLDGTWTVGTYGPGAWLDGAGPVETSTDHQAFPATYLAAFAGADTTGRCTWCEQTITDGTDTAISMLGPARDVTLPVHERCADPMHRASTVDLIAADLATDWHDPLLIAVAALITAGIEPCWDPTRITVGLDIVVTVTRRRYTARRYADLSDIRAGREPLDRTHTDDIPALVTWIRDRATQPGD